MPAHLNAPDRILNPAVKMKQVDIKGCIFPLYIFLIIYFLLFIAYGEFWCGKRNASLLIVSHIYAS